MSKRNKNGAPRTAKQLVSNIQSFSTVLSEELFRRDRIIFELSKENEHLRSELEKRCEGIISVEEYLALVSTVIE